MLRHGVTLLLAVSLVCASHAATRAALRQAAQDPAPDAAIRVACVGDSITWGYLASNTSMSYPNRLQELLGGGYNVTSLGEGGATLQVEGDSPYVERPSYGLFLAGRWDVVVIMLGTNDAKDGSCGGPPNWQEVCSSHAATARSCPYWRDYNRLIADARGRGPESSRPPIVLLGVPPPLMQRSADTMNQTVINDVLPFLVPRIAASAGLAHPIDVFSALGGRPDWRDTFPACGCTLLATHESSATAGFSRPMQGYLPDGNDWQVGNFTLPEAEALCGSSPSCAGITFSSPRDSPEVGSPSGAARMLLKHCPGGFTPMEEGGWWTVLKQPPPPAEPQPDSCRFFCDEQSCDQCHPNDEGYLRIAHAVAEAIHAAVSGGHGRRSTDSSARGIDTI